MKKNLILSFIFLLLLGFNASQAQVKFGTGISFGYGKGAAIDEVNSNYSIDSAGNETDEGLYHSYGKGFTAALLLTARICNNGDFELNIGGFKGKKFTYTDHEDYGFGQVYNETGTFGACGWFLEPMIRLHTNNEDGQLNYYARQGLLIGLGIKNTTVRNASNSYGQLFNTTTDWTTVDRAKTAFGYTGELGLAYTPNNNYEFNFGIYFRGVNVCWKTSSFTEYSRNTMSGSITSHTGIDSLDVNQKEVIYKKTVSDTDNISDKLPTVLLQDFQPLSSVGLRIGFVYHFGSAVTR